MPRGHSNVISLEDIKPYPTNPKRVMIPLVGEAEVNTVKKLPPLSLSEQEWRIIGEKAGWQLESEDKGEALPVKDPLRHYSSPTTIKMRKLYERAMKR